MAPPPSHPDKTRGKEVRLQGFLLGRLFRRNTWCLFGLGVSQSSGGGGGVVETFGAWAPVTRPELLGWRIELARLASSQLHRVGLQLWAAGLGGVGCGGGGWGCAGGGGAGGGGLW